MNNKTEWKRKDLLSIEELSKEEIELILDNAKSFKEILMRPIKKVPTLRGKTVVNLFFEPSTRTRTSFELAAKRLSADIVNIAIQASSVAKGETFKDTAKNIEAMKIDIVVMRHQGSGAPHMLAKTVSASVINAGDGSHEHPTQALLDLFTIREKKGAIKGLKVGIIGDITHSRVARSSIWGLKKLGAEIIVCGPRTLIPLYIEKMGVKVSYDLKEVLKMCDVINVLRIQHERQRKGLIPSVREYVINFGINSQMMKFANKNVIIMHPGPINRGVELSSDVADGTNSAILDQVTNGVAVRMAVLYLVSGFRKTNLNVAEEA